MKTPFLDATLAILQKDLQAELRSRELISTMGMFALLCVLVFSFALQLGFEARREVVGGVLWVTVIFAGVLGLNRSLGSERENGSMDAMLLAPVQRAAIFAGKFVGNWLIALLIGLVLLPLMSVLYNLDLLNGWIALALFLGTAGFMAVGTLLATITAQTRARDTLLTVVILPLALPVLLPAVSATTSILADAPPEQWLSWYGVLLAVDAIYLVLCYGLFGYVVED